MIDITRPVFFISDGTGITAETLGYTLLSQFPHLEYKQITIPFIDTIAKAEKAVVQIDSIASEYPERPLVFASIVNPDIQSVISTCRGKYIDLFQSLIPALEDELSMPSVKVVGQTHSMKNTQSYNNRIEAVNFALSSDDGLGMSNYVNAELILVGVSRCGKTPTSLYLALHFGLYVANFPFTEDDFPLGRLPENILPFKEKIVGLSINPERLQQIRQARRPHSRYASIEQCEYEIVEIEKLYRRVGIPFINTTNHSIEEISAKILAKTELRRKSY